jgi:hypothetical protein
MKHRTLAKALRRRLLGALESVLRAVKVSQESAAKNGKMEETEFRGLNRLLAVLGETGALNEAAIKVLIFGAEWRGLERDERKANLKQVDASAVHASTDENILLSYMECAKCGESLFADQRATIRTSESVDEFINLVEMGLAAHHCKAIHN